MIELFCVCMDTWVHAECVLAQVCYMYKGDVSLKRDMAAGQRQGIHHQEWVTEVMRGLLSTTCNLRIKAGQIGAHMQSSPCPLPGGHRSQERGPLPSICELRHCCVWDALG